MKSQILMLLLVGFVTAISAQSSYKEMESEWKNDPFRFFIAEEHQTITKSIYSDGSTSESEKPVITDRVLIGVDNNGDISFISEDNSIFHTHELQIDPTRDPSDDISTGEDELGEYVQIVFNCEMYFSDTQRNKDYFGPSTIVYQLYTSRVFIISEITESNLGSTTILIKNHYIGSYTIEQAEGLMKRVA